MDFFMYTLVPVSLLKCETIMLLQKKIKEKNTLEKPEKLSEKKKKKKKSQNINLYLSKIPWNSPPMFLIFQLQIINSYN